MSIEIEEKMRLKQELEQTIHERKYTTLSGQVEFVVMVEPKSLKELLTHIIEAL